MDNKKTNSSDEFPKDLKATSRKSSPDRPLKVDESSYDPLTIARMTDHNVTGHPGSRASQIEQDDRFGSLKKKK